MGKFKVDDPNGFEPDSEIDVQTKNDLRELVIQQLGWSSKGSFTKKT